MNNNIGLVFRFLNQYSGPDTSTGSMWPGRKRLNDCLFEKKHKLQPKWMPKKKILTGIMVVYTFWHLIIYHILQLIYIVNILYTSCIYRT